MYAAVVKMIDSSGNTVVEYLYDSWGKLLSVTGTLATTLGADQPFRYRGYVYDEETGWYYLQSRYYDSTTCRFISADVLLSTGQGVIGHNSFAYCLNDPANMLDDEGNTARDFLVVHTKGGSGHGHVRYFKSMDDAAIAFAQIANYYTNRKNVEVCAFIYASSFYDSKKGRYVTYYSMSDIYIGKHDNVIEHFLTKSFGAVGFIHTHPYCSGHCGKESAAFSAGDCLTAITVGVCYMSDCGSGNLYKLTGKNAISGMFNGIYVYSNRSSKKLDKRVGLVKSGLPTARRMYICR
nr:RHS repeat-associated core domain-containing protein [Clostridia bacterium]